MLWWGLLKEPDAALANAKTALKSFRVSEDCWGVSSSVLWRGLLKELDAALANAQTASEWSSGSLHEEEFLLMLLIAQLRRLF